MVFDAAYAANPTCMPNRASLLTGRYPSSHGARVNGIGLSPGSETVARVLRRRGYRTGAAGKLHLQPYGAAEEATRSLVGAVPAAVAGGGEPGWDRWEMTATHRSGPVELPPDYYGFDRVDLVIGGSDTAEGHYRHWLGDRGVEPERVQGRDNALAAFDGWDQVYKTAVPEDLYPTSYIADRTVRFLEEAAASGDDFFFWASFPDPHHPFTPPGRYFDRFDPADVVIPPTFGDPLTRAPAHVRAMAARRGVQTRPFDCWAPDERQLRASLAAAYGMIAMIDDAAGRIMAALDRTGLAERTAVVFTSDHGDMFGDHGLLLKHCVHYQACIRVPFVVGAPGAPAGRTGALTSSLDLAPTVLGLAGAEPYRDMHGTDLSGAVTGRAPAGPGRDGLLVEEDEVFGLPGLSGPVRMRTLITPSARLTVYGGQPFGEMYDRRGDPCELENLHGRPGARRLQQELSDLLLAKVMDAQDSDPVPRFAA